MNHIIRFEKGELKTLVVAEEFGKQHKHVIRTIESLIQDGTLTEPEFGLSEYKDSSGKMNKFYELTEDGFLISMPFIGGKKAREGQRKLVKAFSQMRRMIVRQAEADAKQARLEGKDARRHEVDVIQAFVEYATAQGSENAKKYFINLTSMTYKALFMVEQGMKWKGVREILSGAQLSYLTVAEYVCAKSLKDGMAQSLPYKDIYQLAKERVEFYVASIGKTPALLSFNMENQK